MSDELRLDKGRSTIVDAMRQTYREGQAIRHQKRQLQPRRRGLSKAFFSRREYAVHFEQGDILDHRRTGFGFASPERGAFFVKAARRDLPPEGSEAILALGRITAKGGKPVIKPRYSLVGYLLPDGTVHSAHRSWNRLHGAPFLTTLLGTLATLAGLFWLLINDYLDQTLTLHNLLICSVLLFLLTLLVTKATYAPRRGDARAPSRRGRPSAVRRADDAPPARDAGAWACRGLAAPLDAPHRDGGDPLGALRDRRDRYRSGDLPGHHPQADQDAKPAGQPSAPGTRRRGDQPHRSANGG